MQAAIKSAKERNLLILRLNFQILRIPSFITSRHLYFFLHSSTSDAVALKMVEVSEPVPLSTEQRQDRSIPEQGSVLGEQSSVRATSVHRSAKGESAGTEQLGLVQTGFGADTAGDIINCWLWSYRDPAFLILTLPLTRDLEHDPYIL